MLEPQALQNNGFIKIYTIKNRAASIIGIFISAFFLYLLINDIHDLKISKIFSGFSVFHPSGHLSSTKLFFIGIGIAIALLVLLVSYFPNAVITEKQLKIGRTLGGSIGLTYQHQIPWYQISQIDSGGSRLIQWSPNTSIFYHTGKIPLGHSNDLVEAVISTGLGYRNYCKILTIVLEKAPQAKVDQLTLQLIKKCQKRI